jgi:hypothetical protein
MACSRLEPHDRFADPSLVHALIILSSVVQKNVSAFRVGTRR